MGLFKNLLNATVGAAAAPEVSGKALLKQTVKGYGVDIGRIPEEAWDELVKGCIDQANNFANMSKQTGMVDKANFRTNLVDAVEGTSVMVSEALDPNSRSSLAQGPVRQLLVRHGVLQS